MSPRYGLPPDVGHVLLSGADGEAATVALCRYGRAERYLLAGPAADTWRLAAAGADRTTVLDRLRTRYTGDPDEIDAAATAALAQLVGLGLLTAR